MNDHRRPQNDRLLLTRSGIRRRDFVAGSLAAGTIAFAGGPAWAQNGATVPQACVPPIPPGQPANFTPSSGGPVRV
jgi:hypothetical protein